MRDGGPGTAAPTVGDIYQRLIPYRAVRGELGIMELADYEHALLRLLAGERGYVSLGEERARAEFVAELSSPNPILGVYRDYAAATVRVAGQGESAPPAPRGDPARDSDDTGAGEDVARSPHSDTDELPALPGSVRAADLAPARGSADGAAPDGSRHPHAGPSRAAEAAGEYTPPFAGPDPRTRGSEDASMRSPDSAPSSAVGDEAAAKRCVHCGSGLPPLPDVRFCPECGGDQRDTDCAGCGSSLRAEWRFCIRCGTPRPGVTPRA